MRVFYNEWESYPAEWLRNLGATGLIPSGDVDERSIKDLRPEDLVVYEQAHFFAGIGVWARALATAGWPAGVQVWTGSCPCQPWSAAGKRKGKDDPRHLWPDWFKLIRVCRPAVVFGEQVASPDGYHWLDLVQADLEGVGYSFGAAVLPAASVGAPHARHRIFFCAIGGYGQLERSSTSGIPLANDDDEGRAVKCQARVHAQRQSGDDAPRCGASGRAGSLGHARGDRAEQQPGELPRHEGEHEERASLRRDASFAPGAVGGFWANAEWLYFRDDKFRPVEPGSFPLAHGPPTRVGPGGAREVQSRTGMLKAYGNAIVHAVAEVFIIAVMQSLGMSDPGITVRP